MPRGIPKNGVRRARGSKPAEAKDLDAGQPVRSLPKFEGLQVVKVLDDGHSKTHFHCRMEDGTTMHVPKNKFN